MNERFWEDTSEGDELEPCMFPLTVYRLVLAAGANRDFNPIHHNSEFARSTGAPDMYANNLLLQGMWEKTARAYIGLRGELVQLAGFRMSRFNAAGDTVVTHGKVARRWREGANGMLELTMWSTNGGQVSVGPGLLQARMPLSNP